MTKRFSKQALREYLQSNIKYLEENYGFDNNKGYLQVRDRGIDIIVLFGEYRAYNSTLDDLNAGYIVGE